MAVGPGVQVPIEYVKNQEIVLNIGFEATSGMKLGNEHIEFRARFGGVARDIMVPIDHVVAIYARENGQGMAFPMPAATDMSGRSGPVAESGKSGLRLATDERGAARSTTGAPPALAEVGASADPEHDPQPPAPDGAPSGGGGAAARPALKRIK